MFQCSNIKAENIARMLLGEYSTKKDDSSLIADTCVTSIDFTDDVLLLGSKPHNRPLFVPSYLP